MDDAERQRRNDAIYARAQSRGRTCWLEKKVSEVYRQRLKEMTARLKAEQGAG